MSRSTLFVQDNLSLFEICSSLLTIFVPVNYKQVLISNKEQKSLSCRAKFQETRRRANLLDSPPTRPTIPSHHQWQP